MQLWTWILWILILNEYSVSCRIHVLDQLVHALVFALVVVTSIFKKMLENGTCVYHLIFSMFWFSKHSKWMTCINISGTQDLQFCTTNTEVFKWYIIKFIHMYLHNMILMKFAFIKICHLFIEEWKKIPYRFRNFIQYLSVYLHIHVFALQKTWVFKNCVNNVAVNSFYTYDIEVYWSKFTVSMRTLSFM